ncbi:MAG: DUF4012 domain-containing protein [Actinobacteria bacterium]|nr:DUF4012 domain-containing protein [Actinomycetota bacterium]
MAWTVAGVLGVLLLAGAWLYRGASDARAQLSASREAMAAFTAELAAGDLPAAEAHLAEAEEAVASADASTSDPVWRLASNLPWAGRSPRLVRQVVDVADASVTLADRAMARAPELLSGSAEELRVDNGRFDLGRLEEVSEALSSLPIESLAFARDQLADAALGGVPAVLRDARRDALGLADSAVGTAEGARDLLEVLPDFLGDTGRRDYLLAVQSSGELRGTGGLLGYVGVLAVEDGNMRLVETTVVDPAGEGADGTAPGGRRGGDAVSLTELGGSVDEPVPTSPEFRERYEHVDAASFFSNVNVDPDLPTTAPVVLDLYERYTGDVLDGVIALDPVGMGLILSAIGPIQLPQAGLDELGGLPTTVAPEDVARVTTIDVYEVFGQGKSAERAAYFDALSRGAFARIFASSWEALPVARRIGEAAAGRHVQLYSRDEDEQRTFERLGIAGQLGAAEERSDLLAVTANNAVGGKQDVHLGHHLTAALELGEVRGGDEGPVVARRAEVTIEVENPLPASGMDDYIIGNCLIDQGRNACFEGPRGWNRTWFTIWTPEGTVYDTVVGIDGEERMYSSDTLGGLRAADEFLETAPESTDGFTTTLQGPAPIRREGPELVYALTLWRQAKAIPDHWDLSITPPTGWSVLDVVVEGGGDGQGMGVAGDGSPLEAAVEGEVARVTGAATADAVVEVRFGRSLWGRFLDWFDRPLF